MSDDGKQFGTVQIALRISPELRERVKRAADANNRSVNSELTATLEEKYPAPQKDMIESLMREQEELYTELMREDNPTKRQKLVTRVLSIGNQIKRLSGIHPLD